MTQKNLDYIEMHSTRIFYDHFNLKLYLEISLICKWNKLNV